MIVARAVELLRNSESKLDVSQLRSVMHYCEDPELRKLVDAYSESSEVPLPLLLETNRVSLRKYHQPALSPDFHSIEEVLAYPHFRTHFLVAILPQILSHRELDKHMGDQDVQLAFELLLDNVQAIPTGELERVLMNLERL
jgi:hypothetical protein